MLDSMLLNLRRIEHTYNTMRFERGSYAVVIMVAIKQGPDVALVVDLDSLLLLRVRMRAGLKHEPINSRKYEEFPGKRHNSRSALYADALVASASMNDQPWC